ncbi:DUF86 domain-containing protein [Candidatus Poribacteria bacterium]|nr:DUF86 domain-containing protein [Candidatus Poribacteria bacterium]
MIAIQAFVEGMDFEAFAADDKTSSAVIRKFEILGEATKNVPDEIRQKYPQVPSTSARINAAACKSC